MAISTLTAHAARLRAADLVSLAAHRANQSRLSGAGWTLDLSRHFLDDPAEQALGALAESAGLSGALIDLFSGAEVNPSEERGALHWALRDTSGPAPGARAVYETGQAALALARAIEEGRQVGHTGRPFSAIVHIGIGGSDFGPRLISDAFSDMATPGVTVRFCANLDPLDLDLALTGLDPETTLISGISKSFGTEETLYNLNRARQWLQQALGEGWSNHMALVTANVTRAQRWAGSEDPLVLDLPETVGGRFSIWSAGSLACMISLGPDLFEDFLAGAAAMDQHVRTSPLRTNMAVRLALLDVWNSSVMGFSSRAVLAYSRRLRLLPTYLQQLEMESNGKAVTPDGAPVPLATAPLLWGGEGTIGQHSYHQWLHQGTQIVPAEFILAPGSHSDPEGVLSLSAHVLAQAEVLANGRSLAEVLAAEPGLDPVIAAQKVHRGGRPSTLLYTPTLTPHALGALIALYEHRTFLAGRLWGVNSFDQWGVEAGKTMAAQIKPVLRGNQRAADPVTASLVEMQRGSPIPSEGH